MNVVAVPFKEAFSDHSKLVDHCWTSHSRFAFDNLINLNGSNELTSESIQINWLETIVRKMCYKCKICMVIRFSQALHAIEAA